MISDTDIERAKSQTRYTLKDVHHDHPDCIRIAFEWLDAQVKTKNCTRKALPLKHLIEKWAGRYVSTSDVEVAAQLHPQIKGAYPYFNIGVRLTEPSRVRLVNLPEAFTHGYNTRHEAKTYSYHEDELITGK